MDALALRTLVNLNFFSLSVISDSELLTVIILTLFGFGKTLTH